VESLFAIVEQLSGEELIDLVRDGVGWVVSKIRSWFETARSGGRRLPSRDVDGLEVFSHLSELDRVQSSVGDAATTAFASSFAFEGGPELLTHDVGGVRDREGASFVDDLLGGVGTVDSGEARVLRAEMKREQFEGTDSDGRLMM